MDEAWKSARLDELWSGYVYGMPDFAGLGIVSDRATKALEVLGALRAVHVKALSDGNSDGAAEAARQGRVVWQLLSVEIGNWLLSFPLHEHSILTEEAWEGQDRAALNFALNLHDRAVPDAHRSAVNPMGVLLPKWLVQRLGDALAALDEGEVHELVKPVKSGRHDAAWSWDQMRACAAEHVAFLRGQEFTAETARSKVAKATGIPESTLRDWEEAPSLNHGCEIAFEAGYMKTVFEDNPNYEGIIDTAVLARLNRFRSEVSLGDFGRLYRERFGRRHNRGTAAGN